jgi:CubicO group peptidase (beta-lactamase class C family)
MWKWSAPNHNSYYYVYTLYHMIAVAVAVVAADRPGHRAEWREVAHAVATDYRAEWAKVAHTVGARQSGTVLPCEAVASLVDSLAPKVLRAFNVSGLAVGVTCNHSIVVSKGFGVADRERGKNTTEHTLFQIASNSKLCGSRHSNDADQKLPFVCPYRL